VKILSRRHRKQSNGTHKAREKSVPSDATELTNIVSKVNKTNGFQKTENDSERRLRVTSVYTRKLKDNKDLPESDPEHKRIDRVRLSIPSGELHICEITMSYGSHTIVNKSQSVRDEVIVMQQHSTGENLVIYRGSLIEGGRHTDRSNHHHLVFILYRILLVQNPTTSYIRSFISFL
jgi:hypothetical protein